MRTWGHAEDDLDLVDSFPELKVASGVYLKGRRYVAIIGNPLGMAPMSKKHGNKKKKEWLRRVYNESPYSKDLNWGIGRNKRTGWMDFKIQISEQDIISE